MPNFKAVLLLLFVSLSALASEPTWRGNAFQEVASLTNLPAPIRKALGASEPGLAGVADKGQPFNATDRFNDSWPRRRFLAAAREGDVWLVALEHGGRGYNVQAYLYSGNGDLRNHWVLRGRPKTLQAVLSQIPQSQPRK
jgi:hypothetical protein